MALSWMSELSPHKSDSVASRFLYTVVPAVDYCVVDGVPLLHVLYFQCFFALMFAFVGWMCATCFEADQGQHHNGNHFRTLRTVY